MSSSEVEIVRELPMVRERSGVMLMPVMDLNTAKARLQEFEEFCAHYLQQSNDGGNDGGDYGVIPGTKKKTLLKSGADKLCEVYGLYDEYIIKDTINWETGLFDYELTCILKSRRDDSMVGSGVGSCSSFESKYRWREQKRACPGCGKTTIITGKAEYGGGFICWKKDGRSDGCGAKFKADDKSITEQIQGRIENPDIIDVKNTVLKMAKKRAKIDAVIGVTRSSGLFTQDFDEIPLPPAKPEVPRTPADIPIEPLRSAPFETQKRDSETVQESADLAAQSVKTGRPDPLPPLETLVETAKTVESGKVPAAAKVATSEGRRKTAVTPSAAPAGPETRGDAVKLPEGCVDVNQAVNFERGFKEALPKDRQKEATVLAHAWLKKQGIVDGDGNPTAKAILKRNFYDVRSEAEAYARSL